MMETQTRTLMFVYDMYPHEIVQAKTRAGYATEELAYDAAVTAAKRRIVKAHYDMTGEDFVESPNELWEFDGVLEWELEDVVNGANPFTRLRGFVTRGAGE